MAAVFEDDSTDDEIDVNLQLAERLRINRGEHSSIGRNMKKSEAFKQFCNMPKHPRQDHSSSSSSLEMHHDASISGASSPFMLPNKKRQNGDKSLEQFANSKRTCPSDRFQRSPDWRESKKKSDWDVPYSYTKMLDSIKYSENNSSKRNLFPDKTYEDHINNLADAEDSDLDITCRFPYRTSQKTYSKSPKIIKNQSLSANLSVHPDLYENQVASSSRGVQYIDTDSDDDSRIVMQNGALKGGRQSPDLINYNKKVLGRKVKKVLDSDDTDEDNWQVGYRSRPLVFSSDSEDSSQNKIKKQPSEPVSSISANHSFPFESSCQGNDGELYRATDTFIPSHLTSDVNNSKFLSSATTRLQTKLSPNKPSRTRKNSRISVPSSNVVENSFGQNGSSVSNPVQGRRHSNHAVSSRRSGSPHPRVIRGHRRTEASKCSKGRSLSATRSREEKSNLAATYPDLFDAEESSDVEFFTANSYSDTETSTESLGLRINAAFGNHPGQSRDVFCDRITTVGSSEDEISVIFSSAAGHSRNSEQRRGTSRALGRRYGRGTPRRQLQVTQETVSLSPDPVEQVRQMEEDERYARSLQAEFDAEARAPYPFYRAQHVLVPELPAESDEDIIDPVGDSEPEEPRNFPPTVLPYIQAVLSPVSHRGIRMRRFSRPTTPNMFPNIFYSNRVDARSQRPRITALPTELRGQWHLARILGYEPEPRNMTSALIPFRTSDDEYEAFLRVAELNGDVVTRGLQKTEINRLPTRKYIIPNSATSPSQGSEFTHKRADLNKECQVCLSDYESGDVLRILPCFHEFHTPCIDPWLKINHTCPVCRVIVDLEE